MAQTDVKIVQELSPEEYQKRLETFGELRHLLFGYVKSQARQKATKLPVRYVDVEDLESIGDAQVWIAVLRWNPSKGSSLVSWARRLVWTNRV